MFLVEAIFIELARNLVFNDNFNYVYYTAGCEKAKVNLSSKYYNPVTRKLVLFLEK